MGAAPLVVHTGADAAAAVVTMIFLVITITTGRCGRVGPLSGWVGEAFAAGLGDKPRIADGATKLNVLRIQAQARTAPRLARRLAGGRVPGISRLTPRDRSCRKSSC